MKEKKQAGKGDKPRNCFSSGYKIIMKQSIGGRKMCQCFKCKKEFAETELTWVVINNSLKLICDECKKEKEL